MASAEEIGGLIARLSDENWKVRQEAAFALGKAGENAVAPLLVALADASLSWEARGHAALALREIGDARSFGHLLAALRDKAWQVRGYAAWALGRFGDSRAVEPLIRVYWEDGHEHASVRNWAVSSLGELGDARALDLLYEVLEADKEGGVRAQATKAIQAIENHA